MTASADQDRFLVLLDGHKKVLYKVAYAYCRNREDRGDLVQDMVIELWRAFPRFDARVKFSTWMYRIAMNVAISFHRSEARRFATPSRSRTSASTWRPPTRCSRRPATTCA